MKFITNKVAKRIKELFISLSKDYVKLIYEKEKEISSFGVFTDADISSFFFRYNTKEGIDKIIAVGKKYQEKNPNSKIPVDHYKWWLPEWAINIDEDVFSQDEREIELFKIFEDLIESSEDKDFSNYKDDVFDLFCQSLKEVKDENIFSKTSNNFFLLVQEQDNGIYDARKESLSKILSQNQLEEYLKFNNDDF